MTPLTVYLLTSHEFNNIVWNSFFDMCSFLQIFELGGAQEAA